MGKRTLIDLTGYVWINGHNYRRRTLKRASKGYQDAQETQQRLLAGGHTDWWEKSEKIGSYWGWVRDSKDPKKRNKKILEISENGYSTNWVSGHSVDYYRVMDSKKLPLLLNDPKHGGAKDTIVNILQGKLTSIPKNQKLLDRHHALEKRFHHIYHVSGLYLEFIKRYVLDKYREKIYNRYRLPVFLVLTIEDHIYHFYKGGGGELKLLKDGVHYETLDPNDIVR